MLIVEAGAGEFMCHQSASRGKVFACRGSRCMAWRWFASNKVESRSRLRFIEPVGYYALLPAPSIEHIQVYFELTSDTESKKTAAIPYDDETL